MDKHEIDERECRLQNFINGLYIFTSEEMEMINQAKKCRQQSYENAKRIMEECFNEKTKTKRVGG